MKNVIKLSLVALAIACAACSDSKKEPENDGGSIPDGGSLPDGG